MADGAGPEEVLDAGTAALERNEEEGVPFDEIAGEDRAAVDEMIELLNDPTQRESSAGMDPAGSGLGIMTPRQCYLRTGWAAESSGGVTLSRIRMQIRTCFGTGGVPQNHVNRSDSDVFPPVVDHIHPGFRSNGMTRNSQIFGAITHKGIGGVAFTGNYGGAIEWFRHEVCVRITHQARSGSLSPTAVAQKTCFF